MIELEKKKRILFSVMLLMLFGAALTTLLSQDWFTQKIRFLNANYIPQYTGIFSYLIQTEEITDQQIINNSKHLDWESTDRKDLYINKSDANIWLKFTIKIPEEKAGDWFLSIHWPYFDHISFYVNESEYIIDKWTQQNGRQALFPFSYRFETDGKNSIEVLIKLHTQGKVIVTVTLVDGETFALRTVFEGRMMSFFFGITFIMLLYNMLLGIFTSDRRYLYYTIYVLSILLYTLSITGVGQDEVWGANLWLNTHGYGVFSSIAFMLAAVFIRNFLKLRSTGGWLFHLSTAVMVFWSFVIIVYLFGSPGWILIVEDYGAYASGAIGLLTSIVSWKKGNISAKYLTLAWTPLIISTFVLMLGLTGIIPMTTLVRNIQNIGFVLEILFLSLALAEQINRQRLKTEKAVKLSLQYYQEANEAKERTLAAEIKAKEKLETAVENKTSELRRTMEKLETMNDRLLELSRTDSLTKLANRRHFDEIFEKEFSLSKRQKLPIAVIMGDIDHFKQVNDSYGHQAGDLCLVKVAEIFIKHAGRLEDLTGRYGGEEFISLLTGTDAEEAVNIAGNIRKSIEKMSIADNVHSFQVTISLGVTGGIPEKEETAENFINRADKALYRAKATGRNRVEFL